MPVNSNLPYTKERQARGFSLIELMIAIAVLAFGMSAVLGLFLIAMMNNGRSKGDSSATMIAQAVLEKVAAQPSAAATVPVTLRDCNPAGPVDWNIFTASGGTAQLAANQEINFNAAPVAGYSMQFTSCGSGGRQMIYDVRWAVQNVSNNARVITVGARPAAAAGGGQSRANLFALPITLRTVGGVQ